MKRYDSIEKTRCPKCGRENYEKIEYVYKGRYKGKLSLTCPRCGYKDHRLPYDAKISKKKNGDFIWDKD